MDSNFFGSDTGPEMGIYYWGDGPAPIPDRVIVEDIDVDHHFTPASPAVPPTVNSSPSASPQPPKPTGLWGSIRARYSDSAVPTTGTDRSLGAPSGPYNVPHAPTPPHSGQFSPPTVSFYPPPPGGAPGGFPHGYNAHPQISCDGCSSNVTERPRVRCLECPDYDLCSRCYHERTCTMSHQLWHRQQTILPGKPIERKIRSSRAVYACAVCHSDLTGDLRVKCLDCHDYDLCLDCNLMGAISGRHLTNHRTSFINDNSTLTWLMDKAGEPSEALVRMIEGMFDYMDSTYRPKGTGLLEPEKLSAFYRKMGVLDNENIGLFPDEKIQFQYSSMRCQYMLISNKHEEIGSRATPWTIDALDTKPNTPVLTWNGWIRFFVVCTWRAPRTMHFLLQNAINTGYIKDLRKKNSPDPYIKPYTIPTDAFPGKALHLGEQVIHIKT